MDVPSFDDRSPIYLQIAERIKGEIVSGSLAEGDQVMSTNQYATFFRINPATAAKGFHLLIEDGILHKRRGIGMFVSDGAKRSLIDQRRQRFFAESLDPLLAEVKLLGIEFDEIISRVQGYRKGEEGA